MGSVIIHVFSQENLFLQKMVCHPVNIMRFNYQPNRTHHVRFNAFCANYRVGVHYIFVFWRLDGTDDEKTSEKVGRRR